MPTPANNKRRGWRNRSQPGCCCPSYQTANTIIGTALWSTRGRFGWPTADKADLIGISVFRVIEIRPEWAPSLLRSLVVSMSARSRTRAPLGDADRTSPVIVAPACR